jgi:ubiquinone/menaquinone biosynthesis C-methylase UbiE
MKLLFRFNLYFSFALFSMILLSCQENNKIANEPSKAIDKTSQEILPIKQDENKDRDVWQKPSIVIDLLGDISDKTVADIGAGTGYFTFRLALKAKKVIAIDIENRFLDIINNFKRNLPGDVQEKIETRLARTNDPLLKNEEADMVVIINTIGFISGRKKYLKTLLPGLKKGGKLVIVDYKMKNLPLQDAPPQKDRVHLNVIEMELAQAGYQNIQSNDTSLDYQYIIFASRAL